MIEGARKLKEWRVAEGLTQAEFGRQLGVSQDQLSRWEGGATTPRVRILFDIERLTSGAVPASAWAERAA
jgi:transcriptional regulator with XRE-family HTH domain